MKASAVNFLHGAKQAALVTFVLMVLCGLVFPVALWGISSLIFPHQAGGSLISHDRQTLGSSIVGQEFTRDYFLWGRPSAYHYNVYVEGENGALTYRDGSAFPGVGSGSHNFAPTNPKLAARVEADMASFLNRNPGVQKEDIPTDLLTASGSGLDPHISPASAELQVARISAASGLSEAQVLEIIASHTEGKLLGVFGENTVNVLAVNVALAQAMGLLSGQAK